MRFDLNWLPYLLLQVQDQTYEQADNAALVRNYETGTPVRVFRGQKAAKGYPVYMYEGLYIITGHKMAPSADGPLVRFTPHPMLCYARRLHGGWLDFNQSTNCLCMVVKNTMQGVPRHLAVSVNVKLKANHIMTVLTLASNTQPPPTNR